MLADAPLSPLTAARGRAAADAARADPAHDANPLGPKMTVERLDFFYGRAQALHAIDLDLRDGEILAFIGPSGCGKSTLLKCLNRMHDDTAGARLRGRVRLRDAAGAYLDIHAPDLDPPMLRRRFGWVAQRPNPFPTSVASNVGYGARLHGLAGATELPAHIERALRRAGLWEELGERLFEPGTALSVGQQQRLCIARALALEPEVLLMDEPCGSLDPITTERIEALMLDLKGSVSTVLVTHNMSQAARVADRVAFFDAGRLLELGAAEKVLLSPEHPRLQAYLAGRFG